MSQADIEDVINDDERRMSRAHSYTVVERKTSVLPGIFIVANAAIGVGTLNFPQAFAKSGGLPFAIPLLILCAGLSGFALSVCAWGCREARATQYFELCQFYCGTWANYAFTAVIFLTLYGASSLYLILIGNQSDSINEQIFGLDTFCDNFVLQHRFMICCYSLIFCFPLCLARDVDFLKYPSLLSVFSMIYLMLVITVDYCINGTPEDAEIVTEPAAWTDVFLAFPTLLLGYQCMTNACPVFGNLREQSPSSFGRVVAGSVFTCSLIYLPTAMFGYLANGKDVQDNVLLSYDSSQPQVLIAQIAVLVTVMMSYPVVCYVLRCSVEPFYQDMRRLHNPEYDPTGFEVHRRITIVVLFFCATLLTALVVPDISIAVNFTGSLAPIIYLIFPGLFMIRTTEINTDGKFTDKPRTVLAMKILGVFSAGLGGFLWGLIFWQAVQSASDSSSDVDVCKGR